MLVIEIVHKWTVDKLLKIAAQEETNLALLLVPEIVDDPKRLADLRRTARKTKEDAFACAVWMEKNGIKELEHVGPFMNPFGPTIPDGHVLMGVTIKKGAKISSTNPKYSRAKGGKVAGRTYKVTAHRMHPGYVHDGEVRQGVVVWAGEGCYWYETDLNNVIIEEGP